MTEAADTNVQSSPGAPPPNVGAQERVLSSGRKHSVPAARPNKMRRTTATAATATAPPAATDDDSSTYTTDSEADEGGHSRSRAVPYGISMPASASAILDYMLYDRSIDFREELELLHLLPCATIDNVVGLLARGDPLAEDAVRGVTRPDSLLLEDGERIIQRAREWLAVATDVSEHQHQAERRRSTRATGQHDSSSNVAAGQTRIRVLLSHEAWPEELLQWVQSEARAMPHATNRRKFLSVLIARVSLLT